jgi:hypothetical protein
MAMAAIFTRLQKLGVTLPEMYDENGLWSFSTEIEKKNTAFFQKLVQAHITLTLEYSIHCARLANDFKLKEKEARTALRKDIEAALMMADLLECIYEHYLDVPREVERLRRDQVAFRKLLNIDEVQVPEKNKKETPLVRVFPSSKDVRDFAATANWPRFFFIRCRRLLLSLAPFFDENGPYRQIIRQVDPYVGATLSYVAWMYFIPRLTVNLFLLGKHFIPGNWMATHEQELDWKIRLKAHFERRWFEVANDVVWFMGGLINCFILVGTFAPYNVYFSVVLQAYDVFLATVRTYVELGRLNRLKNEYLEMLKEASLPDEEEADIKRHLRFLDQRIEYEQKRMNIGIVNNTILLFAMMVAVPYFAFNPIMPVFAAIVILANTVGAYNASRLLEKNKPADKIGHLEFSPQPPDPENSDADLNGSRPISNIMNKLGVFKPPSRPLSRSDTDLHRFEEEPSGPQ